MPLACKFSGENVIFNREWHTLAIDDKLATKFIIQAFPKIQIIRTQDLVVEMIRARLLDVTTADLIKKEWEEKYRFRLNFVTFADIL